MYVLLLSYLACIADRADNIGQCIFRGQANSAWPLVPSAWRKCKSSLEREPTLAEFREYHVQLLMQHPCTQCNSSQSPLSDLETLANIQHYCDRTWLLDFTCSIFVALWFATSQQEHQDGAVMILDTNNPRLRPSGYQELATDITSLIDSQFASATDTVCHWHPDILNNRIYWQECDFLFGHPRVVENLNYQTVTIKREDKKTLQTEMKRYLVVAERQLAGGLFQDSRDGLGATIHPPADLAFQEENETLNANDGALMIYNRAINLGFRSFMLYFARAGHRLLYDQNGAHWSRVNADRDLDRAEQYHDRGDKRSAREKLRLAQGFANRPGTDIVNGIHVPVWPK